MAVWLLWLQFLQQPFFIIVINEPSFSLIMCRQNQLTLTRMQSYPYASTHPTKSFPVNFQSS